MNKKILIMAGGTGGHIFPALAVADYLQQENNTVYWLGTPNSMEARLIPTKNIPFYTIDISGIRRTNFLTLLTAPFRLLRATWQAIKIIHSIKPDVILGMGGFASGPGGIAAKLLNKPLVIHEQNAVAGFTNKTLAHFARCVLQAFPHAFADRLHPVLIGNPVRSSISNLPEPAIRFAARTNEPIHILILGGSQGAIALNKLIPEALTHFPDKKNIMVRHQAGQHLLQECQTIYQNAGINTEVFSFIEDMADAYGWADLVICRAGALTIAELAAAGIGSILVPFPYAVDDHQTKNAEYLSQVGAAEIISQNELTVNKLMTLLTDKFCDRNHLLSMANAARSVRKINATADVVKHCLELCHG